MTFLADPFPPPATGHAGHHGHGAATTPPPGSRTVGEIAGWHELAAWRPSPGWLVLVVVLAGGYLVAVAVLRRRGVRWPLGRSAAWLGGVVTLAAMTCTGVGQLGAALFSVHMGQHMVLSMLTPILLLLGAPITLALRVLPAIGRAGGPRRLLLKVLQSRVAKVVSHPGVTVPLFVTSLFGLYFTQLLDLAMGSHVGHQLMLIHFLMVGLLFFGPILAVDPWPRRSAPGLRLLEMLTAVPFHAFFGVIVMGAGYPLSDTFAASARALGVDPLADQATGGGIAWGFGETPILIVTLAVFVQWVRTDSRAARRFDRQAARDGDAELAAYNARLRLLNDRQPAS
ncbi:cytochrome c oxidase assembly protein [Kribbella sp. NPDC051718]|uniref:cytochrome c oxidase assembly protein n=1 Tax=Kribbella sp. NPDC051718 TaxID=3155168 RepID=UPI00342D9D6F